MKVHLPADWPEMNASARSRWLHSKPGLSGIEFKKQTGQFHANAFVGSLGVTIYAAGRDTLEEAITLRNHLRTMASAYGVEPCCEGRP